MRPLVIVPAAGVAFALAWCSRAAACGCFVAPDATAPIVQAGERILSRARTGS